MSEAYPYNNVYEVRGRRTDLLLGSSIADNLIRGFDSPGEMIWTQPEKEDGPIIASIVGQFLYGRPVDRGGSQNNLIQLGYGSSEVREKFGQ